MKFDTLVEKFADRPYFEQKEVLAWTQNSTKSVQNQLSNWSRKGKLTRLRRGKYLLNEPYRKRMPSVYYVSNCLLRPSYVSLQTALQYHGLIPEAVAQIQAMTPKHGRSWETELGTFKYVSIKQDRFWGYRTDSKEDDRTAQNRFLMARPEKALIDLFYTNKGTWGTERIKEMRFQNFDKIDFDLLQEFAKRMNSPKVTEACQNLASIDLEGTE